MISKHEIRREVEKLSSTYTAEDLFSSSYFKEMLQATVTSVCENLGRIPEIHTVCDPENSLTAATQGQAIMVNTMGPLIRNLDTNWEKYVSIIGHVVHESGHVLFTDFENQNQMLSLWFSDNGFSFYPNTPDIKGAREAEEYLRKNPRFRMLYASLMRRVVNTMEDAYIERRLCENYSGLAVAGLATANKEMYRISPNLEDFLSEVLDGRMLPLMVLDSIILSRYVIGREMKRGRSLSEEEDEILSLIEKAIASAEEELESLLFEQDGLKRCELFNRLLVKFFELMPLPSDEQNREGKEGDDPSDYSQDFISSLMQSLRERDQKGGKSAEPKGDSSSIKQEQGKTPEDAKNSKENGIRLSESEGILQRELNCAIKEAARDAVLVKAERAHNKDLKAEVKAIETDLKKYQKGSSFQSYELARAMPNSLLYRQIYSEVSKTSKNLTRKINNILHGRETDSSEGGFLFGQRFDARDLVKRDGKYFSRQVIPDGKPDVAFGILIDESGSMNARGKVVTARRAAILIEDALRNLGIPLFVAGHTENTFGVCRLNIYVDSDTCDGKDSLRLAEIKAKGGNIDGAAITYMAEKLLKRPEKTKVLLVISDGLPAGSSFYSDNPNEDTKMAVEKYRKKKIKIFGAVVDQFEEVTAIYGDKYSFDCRECGSLERELIRIIKRYVLYK